MRNGLSKLLLLKAYAPYIHNLQRLLAERHTNADFHQLAERAVNGEASARLVELVSTYHLKRAGAFFTSSDLSARAAAQVPEEVAPGTRVADPACGAGNLLLAAARKLPMRRGLVATLRLWGLHLAGFDVHPEFIRAAHLRLAVLALSRGAEFDLSDATPLMQLLPNIRSGDGRRELRGLPAVTHLVINPPFGPVTTPVGCTWARGKVTKAAVFFEQCLRALKPGTEISAILPDVLRAGSRYQCWREMVEQLAEVRSITPIGNFETADVDVFLLNLHIHAGKPSAGLKGRWWTKPAPTESVGTHFDVHVGAVVPHRLKPREGPTYPYLHAKQLPFWGHYKPDDEEVAFAGAAVKPPFVAVRRTSSPSDRYRALATIIRGSALVAVENHLITCHPKERGLGACERLLEVLQNPATNQFLNERIRCRHLTVGVVREIPWIT